MNDRTNFRLGVAILVIFLIISVIAAASCAGFGQGYSWSSSPPGCYDEYAGHEYNRETGETTEIYKQVCY